VKDKPRNIHYYDVEVMKDGRRWMVWGIEAVNRTQAAARVRKETGAEIASVNMIG
jgi:hypothetical protein